ncbi:hypothetical protein Ancab_039464 [Ancistrocladus abbreviatus]
MRPFGEAKSISGHQTLQLMRRPYGVKGSVYVVTLPAFQRCLEDGPDTAEQRPGSGFPTSRGTGDGHLKAHHDLQATPARPGKATRLEILWSKYGKTPFNSRWKRSFANSPQNWEDHFEIFEHIRGFNVTIVTSANTQDETLLPWSGFLQKDEGEDSVRCRKSEIYEITNVDCSQLNMN